MVGSDTSAAEASSSCDQPSKARAAFSCLIDTFSIDKTSLLIDTKSIDEPKRLIPKFVEFGMSLEFAATAYRAIRDRISAEDPTIDERTLADTVEGLTDLHEILAAIIRSALSDEALANGLKNRVGEMQERLDRLQDRASKRRQIAKDVMLELNIKKITAPDFSVSVRPGLPALQVLDEASVPSIYWQPGAPRLKRQELLSELKTGTEIEGVSLSNPEPVLSVRVK